MIMYNSQAHFFNHPLSFPRKRESNNKSLRNQMVFRIPASAGMTETKWLKSGQNQPVPRIRGNERHYWQIRMLVGIYSELIKKVQKSSFFT